MAAAEELAAEAHLARFLVESVRTGADECMPTPAFCEQHRLTTSDVLSDCSPSMRAQLLKVCFAAVHGDRADEIGSLVREFVDLAAAHYASTHATAYAFPDLRPVSKVAA